MAKDISGLTTKSNYSQKSSELEQTDEFQDSEAQNVTYGGRSVGAVEVETYHDRLVGWSESTDLSRRNVSRHSQDVIVSLAKSGQFADMSSTIEQCCDSLEQLDRLIALIVSNGVELNEELQNILSSHFERLFVMEKFPLLVQGLTK